MQARPEASTRMVTAMLLACMAMCEGPRALQLASDARHAGIKLPAQGHFAVVAALARSSRETGMAEQARPLGAGR